MRFLEIEETVFVIRFQVGAVSRLANIVKNFKVSGTEKFSIHLDILFPAELKKWNYSTSSGAEENKVIKIKISINIKWNTETRLTPFNGTIQ